MARLLWALSAGAAVMFVSTIKKIYERWREAVDRDALVIAEQDQETTERNVLAAAVENV